MFVDMLLPESSSDVLHHSPSFSGMSSDVPFSPGANSE